MRENDYFLRSTGVWVVLYPLARITKRTIDHQTDLFCKFHFSVIYPLLPQNVSPIHFTFWSVKLDGIMCDMTLCIKYLPQCEKKGIIGLSRKRGCDVHGRCFCRSRQSVPFFHPCVTVWALNGWRVKSSFKKKKGSCFLGDMHCHSGGPLKPDFIEGNRWNNIAQILRSIPWRRPRLRWFKEKIARDWMCMDVSI